MLLGIPTNPKESWTRNFLYPVLLPSRSNLLIHPIYILMWKSRSPSGRSWTHQIKHFPSCVQLKNQTLRLPGRNQIETMQRNWIARRIQLLMRPLATTKLGIARFMILQDGWMILMEKLQWRTFSVLNQALAKSASTSRYQPRYVNACFVRLFHF